MKLLKKIFMNATMGAILIVLGLPLAFDGAIMGLGYGMGNTGNPNPASPGQIQFLFGLGLISLGVLIMCYLLVSFLLNKFK